MKLEDDIGSVIAKEGGAGGGDPVDFVSAPFSSWTDVPQVLKFCCDYLKLEDGHELDNCQYLLEKLCRAPSEVGWRNMAKIGSRQLFQGDHKRKQSRHLNLLCCAAPV